MTHAPRGLKEFNPTHSKFCCLTSNAGTFDVLKGNLNKFRIRPQIQNEHVESSREGLLTVSASVNGGQLFKASKPNINGISLTAQSAATFSSIDAIVAGGGEKKAGTMEYSASAALQAEYIKSGADEATRVAFTDVNAVTQDGSYCMQMDMSGVVDDEWRVTVTSTDLTDVMFSLKYAQTAIFAQAKMFFFISDGTNGKSFLLTSEAASLWQTISFSESDMTIDASDDGGAAVSIGAITKMGFRIDDRQVGTVAYADSINYQAEGGSFDLELWGFGTTLPTGDGTEDYTAGGTQYAEIGDRGIGGVVLSSINIPLLGGKRKYHIDAFIAGVALEIPDNTVLVEGEYYGIVAKYVDTDVLFFGADTSYETPYYSKTNGYAWKAEAADNFIDKIDGAVGTGAYSDLMFQIFSTQPVYIISANLSVNAAPSINSDVSVFLEDEHMVITDIPISFEVGGFGLTSLPIDLSVRPPYLPVGGKFEAYFNDDATDTGLTKASFSMKYLYEHPDVNGTNG